MAVVHHGGRGNSGAGATPQDHGKGLTWVVVGSNSSIYAAMYLLELVLESESELQTHNERAGADSVWD